MNVNFPKSQSHPEADWSHLFMTHTDTFKAIFTLHDIYRPCQNILKIYIQPLLQTPNVTQLCSFVQIDTLLNVTHVRGLTGREWACIDWGGRQSSGQPATLFCSTATHTHARRTHTRQASAAGEVPAHHSSAIFQCLAQGEALWHFMKHSAEISSL